MRGEGGDVRVSAKVCYQQYFALDEGQDAASLAEALPQDVVEDSAGARALHDLGVASGFLYGDGLNFACERRAVPDGPTSVLANGRRIPVQDGHVLVSCFADFPICQVSVCLAARDVPVDDLVYLHQVQCAALPLFSFRGGPSSIPEFCRGLLASCGMSVRNGVGTTAYMCEVNAIEGVDALADIDERCRAMLYGVLTGDEGWAHVPAELADRRYAEGWGTRSFVRAMAFHNNFLLVNLNASRQSDEYLAGQRRFSAGHWGGLNEYFTMDAPTAGVNHGLFFSVETGMFVRTLSDVVLAERSSLALSGRQRFLGREIERNKRLRADMVRALNKVTELHISEMGELDAMVSRSLDVSERIRSIQTLLELLESELELMYDTNTNRVVNLIAVVGLVFAALQVVVSIPSLFG